MSGRPRPSAGYRIDWSALLCRLRARTGQPLSRIGQRVSMDWRTINRLARGEIQEPRFSQGLSLLDLAADHLDAADWDAVRHPMVREAA